MNTHTPLHPLSRAAIILGIGLFVANMNPSISYALTRDVAAHTVREMMMGGSVVAVSIDDSALMFNPAGLARIKGPSIKAPRLNIAIGTEFVDASDKINKLKSANSDDTAIIDELIGTNGSVLIGFSPLFAATTKGLGASAYGGSNFHLGINHDGSLDMTGYIDSVGAIGLARSLSLFGVNIDLGVSAKAIARSNFYDKMTGKKEISLSESDLIDRINDNTLEDAFNQYMSYGLGVDVGAMADFSLFSAPATVGFVVRNIGGSLTGEKEVGTGNVTTTVTDTETLPLIADIGVSVTPKLPLIGDVLLCGDYRFNPAGNVYNSLRFGLEKKLFFDTVLLQIGRAHV